MEERYEYKGERRVERGGEREGERGEEREEERERRGEIGIITITLCIVRIAVSMHVQGNI